MQALTRKHLPFYQFPSALNPVEPVVCERKAHQKES